MTLDTLFIKYSTHPDFLGEEKLNDINQKGSVDDSLIHIIARNGTQEELLCLLQNGADINLQGDMGFTALHYAAMNNRTDNVITLLTYKANKQIKNEFGQTPYDIATIEDNKSIINLLK